MDDTASELDDLVARVDPDRYVAALFAPAERRRGLIALYAFDHEVARIAEVVHEPMVGHIRLAWWRQQIDAIYSGGALHAPTARALAETVRAHGLPRELLDRYVDARACDVEGAPFDDEGTLERHALAVSAGMAQLAARVLGAEARADDAARYAGIALAYAGHLDALARDAQRRHCRLPIQWLREAGLGAEDVFAGRMTPALKGVLVRMAGAAQAALGKLRAHAFPMSATPALAAATLSRVSIRRVRGPNFDPFRAAQPMAQWQRVARIALANLTWRI